MRPPRSSRRSRPRTVLTSDANHLSPSLMTSSLRRMPACACAEVQESGSQQEKEMGAGAEEKGSASAVSALRRLAPNLDHLSLWGLKKT